MENIFVKSTDLFHDDNEPTTSQKGDGAAGSKNENCLDILRHKAELALYERMD